METTTSKPSDSELLSRFQKCSPKTGDRLVMYAELKKRNLLGFLKDDSPLLFKGTTPLGGFASVWVAIGVLILIRMCMVFKGELWAHLTAWLLLFMPFLNLLNLLIYKSVFIYPNRITVATCLCLDKLQLTGKTIKFGEQGLYLNAYYYHLRFFVYMPKEGAFFLRPIPFVTPLVHCSLRLEILNKLLWQLQFFFEAIGQNVILGSNSPEIPTDELAPLTDFKGFCLRQPECANTAGLTTASVNWLRLIASVSERPIPEAMQRHPLPYPPAWLEADEEPVLCLNACIGFLNKAYCWLTTHRVVWTTLAGEYVNGATYNNVTMKPSPTGWLLEYEKNVAGILPKWPYPFTAIFTHFAQWRSCK